MKLLFLVLALCLVGCSSPPPDVMVFEYLQPHLSTDPVNSHLVLTASPTCLAKIGESECGHGVSIVTGTEVFVGEGPLHLYKGKKWSELRAESVYVPAVESYAPLSAYMIDMCKKMDCSSQVDAFRIKLNSLNGISGAISNP